MLLLPGVGMPDIRPLPGVTDIVEEHERVERERKKGKEKREKGKEKRERENEKMRKRENKTDCRTQ